MNHSRRYLIFAVLGLGYILVYFHRLCSAVVAVDMEHDLSATGGLLGAMAAAYFWPYALMQLPAGLLADSLGPRKTISSFFLLAFAGSVIISFAPTVGVAILGRTLVGFGVSMLFVSTMKVLAVWFSQREFPVMTGILVAVGGIGSLSATGPLARVNEAFGWRSSFLMVGLATLGLAALVFLVVRDRPPAVAGEEVRAHTAAELWAGFKRVVAHGPFWPLAVWFFFECAIFFAFFGLWGGPYLTQVYHLTKPEAGDLLSMGAVGMIVGSPALSWLSNRRGRRTALRLSAACAAALTGFLALRPAGLPVPALYAILFGLGLTTNAIVSVGFTAAKELFPVRMAGAATGTVNLFPFLGGALLQPLIGVMLERGGRDAAGKFLPGGYQVALGMFFGCAAIALFATLFMRETLGRKPAP